MAYQKPAEICMSLFGGPAVCNDDPILRFIPLEKQGNYYWPMGEASGDLESITTAGTFSVGAAPTYLQPSMRADSAGKSIAFDNFNDTAISSVTFPYANGVTIEIIVKPDDIAPSSSSRIAGAVDANVNSSSDSLWVLRFDNYDFGDTVPVFTLVNRNEVYAGITQNANKHAEVRSTTEIVLGNVYHLMATIRPSNNTIEFWVNGVSIGTDTITDPDEWFFPASSGGEGGSGDLLAGNKATKLSVGDAFIGGAFREQNSTRQDLKIHLLEADQAFAEAQAGFAGFTQ